MNHDRRPPPRSPRRGARRQGRVVLVATMSGELYGGKCHLCGCLTGPTHDVEPLLGFAAKCPRCEFCQNRELMRLLREHAADIFSPEVRQAVRDLMEGRANPIIDQLRAEIADESRPTPAVQGDDPDGGEAA